MEVTSVLVAIGIFLFLVAFFVFIHYVIPCDIYGKPIDNEKVHRFLNRYENDFVQLDADGDSIHVPSLPTFISKKDSEPLFKYYIHGYGVVWRFSDASRRIDELFNKLCQKRPADLDEL